MKLCTILGLNVKNDEQIFTIIDSIMNKVSVIYHGYSITYMYLSWLIFIWLNDFITITNIDIMLRDFGLFIMHRSQRIRIVKHSIGTQ